MARVAYAHDQGQAVLAVLVGQLQRRRSTASARVSTPGLLPVGNEANQGYRPHLAVATTHDHLTTGSQSDDERIDLGLAIAPEAAGSNGSAHPYLAARVRSASASLSSFFCSFSLLMRASSASYPPARSSSRRASSTAPRK